jgi:uncharacterized surface protein with fasciclin (FAS1) repeats
MKHLPLIAATLSLCSLASAPAFAQQTTTDSNTYTSSTTSAVNSTSTYPASNDSLSMDRPSVMVDPSTGGTVYVVPPHASDSERDRADWIFHNLDDEQVRMYRSQGYRDYEIRGAAHIAMRTGLPMQYILDRVRITGDPLWSIANEYGLSVHDIYRDIPGYGSEAIAYAPADLYANPNAPMIASTATNSVWSSTATAASSSLPPVPAAGQGDLIAVISGDPRFSTLASAMRSAGLVSNLQMPGPFTLFAPTNDAFAKLPAGTLDNLLRPENQAQLRAVLLYHVVSGKMMSSDLAAMSAPGTPKTLEGDSITVTNVAPFKVNSTNIVAADIPAANGVIDAIDVVLMPPASASIIASSPAVPSSAPAASPSAAPSTDTSSAPAAGAAAPSATPSATAPSTAAPDTTTTPSTAPAAPAPAVAP